MACAVPEAVKTLVEEGPERIEELIAWGKQFDRNGTKLVFGRESAHSHNQILQRRAIPRDAKSCAHFMPRRRACKNISVA